MNIQEVLRDVLKEQCTKVHNCRLNAVIDVAEGLRRSDWKMKLNEYLNNPNGSINSGDLEKDNLCSLGKWLHGEGRAFEHHPEYKQLLQDHASFHKSAADIVIRKNKGEDIKGDVALGSNSPFSKYSMSVVSLLMKMKALVK